MRYPMNAARNPIISAPNDCNKRFFQVERPRSSILMRKPVKITGTTHPLLPPCAMPWSCAWYTCMTGGACVGPMVGSSDTALRGRRCCAACASKTRQGSPQKSREQKIRCKVVRNLTMPGGSQSKAVQNLTMPGGSQCKEVLNLQIFVQSSKRYMISRFSSDLQGGTKSPDICPMCKGIQNSLCTCTPKSFKFAPQSIDISGSRRVRPKKSALQLCLKDTSYMLPDDRVLF